MINLKALRANLGGKDYFLRYATTTRQLTRGSKTFTESLAMPATHLVPNESFAAKLTNKIATADAAATGTDFVATFAGPSVGLVLSTGAASSVGTDRLSVSVGVVTLGFFNNTAVPIGKTTTGSYTVDYIGTETVTVTTPDSTGDFAVALSNTILSRTGAGALVLVTGDLTVSGSTTTVKSIAGDAKTVTFTTTLTAGQSISVEYFNRESLDVPDTGLFDNNIQAGVGGEPFTLDLKADWLPLQDTNGDGTVSTADLTISVAGILAAHAPRVTGIGITSLVLNTANGSPQGTTITLAHSGDTLSLLDSQGTARKLSVSYQGLEDLVTVKGANNVSIPIRLRETGPNTGVFTGVLFAVDGSNNQHDVTGTCSRLSCNLDPTATSFGTGDSATIAVIDGGAINVAYGDRSPVISVPARVQVESEPPTFQNTAPDDKAITNVLDTILSTEISDTIAGVNSTLDLVTGTTTPKSIGLTLTVDTVPTAVSTSDITVTETAAGSGIYTVQYNINKITKIADAITAGADITSVIAWVFVAKDKAGNGTGSGVRTLNLVKVKPLLVGVFAGDNWNPTTKRLESSRLGIGKDDRTSILVEFNQPLDPGSIQAADFTVDGVNPISVAHFKDIATGAFLTVPLMAPGATPVVALVGEVKDTGGNSLTTGTKTSIDGIAPALTATIANNFTKGDIELNVKSDEPIAGSRPNIVVNLCTQFKGSTTNGGCTTKVTPATSTSIVTERAEWNFKLTGLGTGRYNITGDAYDVKVNKGTVGNADVTNSDALSFEIDKALPSPTAVTVTPTVTGTANVLLADPIIIRIDWASEGDGTEYTGDTHSKVELTKAELNGTSVLGLASSKGGAKVEWTITIPKSTLGATEADQVKAHKLVFNGTDELGNKLATDQTKDFTVVKKPAYQLALTPGINLISLPSQPLSTAIDDVITSTDDVNLVFTYDPTDPKGPWLVASRSSIGETFQGDLKTIDAKHAYFVRAISPVTLKVALPTPDPLTLFIPPTIAVHKGWNLIPVSDITQSAAGAFITTYPGITFSRALTYDPTKSPPWQPTLAGKFATGAGYWVWFSSPGLIVP